MVLPVVLFAATAPLVPPTLPPMCAPEFQKHVLAVETALAKSDFDSAERLANSLPSTNFTLVWNDAKLSATDRADFREARDAAIRHWQSYFANRIGLAGEGDLKIGFQPELADDPETGAPPALITFVGTSRPRVEGVIGLKRGENRVVADPVHVYNDTLHILGAYFGLAQNVAPNGAMTPSVLDSPARHGLTVVERLAVRGNLKVVDFLRKAIKNRTPVVVRQPDLFLTPNRYEGDAVQGDLMDISLQLTNRGTGPLSYRVEGDCGCMVSSPPGEVAPNATSLIKVSLDTKDFLTRASKVLRVYTNDPKAPVQQVPVELDVTPRYRFLIPGGNAVNLEEGREFDIFLAVAPENPMKIRAVRLNGLEGKVEYQEWTGVMADPELGGPEKERKGYKLHVSLSDAVPPGRSLVGLDVATDSAQFPILSHTLSVQKGILVTPEELFMGELTKRPKRATLTMSRPGKPLVVEAASIDARTLRVTTEAGRTPSEVKVHVDYDGTAPSGDLFATITLRLKDENQSVIKIPVTATVR